MLTLRRSIKIFKLRIYSFDMNCDKNLVVNGRKFPVNTAWLSMCSSVFAAMFRTDMKERHAIDVPIGDVSSAQYFEDFLASISPDRQTFINRRIFNYLFFLIKNNKAFWHRFIIFLIVQFEF